MAFNSREYEFADITVMIGGKDIIGLRGIKYTEKIEREHLHAKGRKPFSIQSGNLSYEGEITMLQSEADALKKAGKGSLLSLAVDVVVSYGNPSSGDAIVTDVISGVRFTEDSREYKQGDKFAEIKLAFLALDVKRKEVV